MPLPYESFHDDQLIGYLLGSLPADEAECLDEQTLIDDELAGRLRMVEDDLVDAYAGGRLTGDLLRRFEFFYLASPRRREKATFAREFAATVDGSEPREQPVTSPVTPPVPQPAAETVAVRARLFAWPLAAAAVFFLGMSLLFLQDVQLRRALKDAGRQAAASSQRATAIATELEEQKRAAAAATQARADARAVEQLATVALVLLPQTRGVDSTPIIAVAPGSGTVPLDLQIEAASPARYEVALKDPATNQVVWRSPPITRQRVRRPPMVTVDLPATLLKPQHYALDLFELRTGVTPVFAGSYAFEVARR